MKVPAVTLEEDRLGDLDAALGREWLLADGRGGYAASTVVGANTRGCHGLLVVPAPDGSHAVLLAKLEEVLHLEGRQYHLSTNIYGDTVHPEGYRNLVSCEVTPGAVRFTYRAGPCTVRKTVFCRHGLQAAAVLYEVSASAELEVRPMVAGRPVGERVSADGPADRGVNIAGPGSARIRLRPGLPPLFLLSNAGDLDRSAFWYERLTYPREGERGGGADGEGGGARGAGREDLMSPFGLRFATGPERPAFLVAAAEEVESTPDLPRWLAEERRRLADLVAHIDPPDEHLAHLVAAADRFLARAGGRTVVWRGYPGRDGWSRETFIALPGLALVTGAYGRAREVLLGYLPVLRRHLAPRAQAEGASAGAAEGIDAPLWFVHAVGEYWRYTQDLETVSGELLPACREVVRGYLDGSLGPWKAGADGLVRTFGGSGLTWLESAAGPAALPSRAGKPVEVQALWYNALRTLDWLESTVRGKRLTQYAGLADIARASFLNQFWNYRTSSLHDVVQAGGHDTRLRPNQVLAASLPFTMLNGQQMRGVVEACRRHLLTPVGLRGLSPEDPDYLGGGEGGSAGRGAAWPWLMGPFLTAYLRAFGRTPEAVRTCREWLAPLFERLLESGCPGCLEERFDGDPPHRGRGAIASAVNTAEVLRVLWEDLLGRRGTGLAPLEAAPRGQRQRTARTGRRWGRRR